RITSLPEISMAGGLPSRCVSLPRTVVVAARHAAADNVSNTNSFRKLISSIIPFLVRSDEWCMKERSILVILLFSVIALRADEALRRIPEDEAKKAVMSKVNPEYPPMARQMRLMGKVQVDALIDAQC